MGSSRRGSPHERRDVSGLEEGSLKVGARLAGVLQGVGDGRVLLGLHQDPLGVAVVHEELVGDGEVDCAVAGDGEHAG